MTLDNITSSVLDEVTLSNWLPCERPTILNNFQLCFMLPSLPTSLQICPWRRQPACWMCIDHNVRMHCSRKQKGWRYQLVHVVASLVSSYPDTVFCWIIVAVDEIIQLVLGALIAADIYSEMKVSVLGHDSECTNMHSDFQVSTYFSSLTGPCLWLAKLGRSATTSSRTTEVVNLIHHVA